MKFVGWFVGSCLLAVFSGCDRSSPASVAGPGIVDPTPPVETKGSLTVYRPGTAAFGNPLSTPKPHDGLGCRATQIVDLSADPPVAWDAEGHRRPADTSGHWNGHILPHDRRALVVDVLCSFDHKASEGMFRIPNKMLSTTLFAPLGTEVHMDVGIEQQRINPIAGAVSVGEPERFDFTLKPGDDDVVSGFTRRSDEFEFTIMPVRHRFLPSPFTDDPEAATIARRAAHEVERDADLKGYMLVMARHRSGDPVLIDFRNEAGDSLSKLEPMVAGDNVWAVFRTSDEPEKCTALVYRAKTFQVDAPAMPTDAQTFVEERRDAIGKRVGHAEVTFVD